MIESLDCYKFRTEILRKKARVFKNPYNVLMCLAGVAPQMNLEILVADPGFSKQGEGVRTPIPEEVRQPIIYLNFLLKTSCKCKTLDREGAAITSTPPPPGFSTEYLSQGVSVVLLYTDPYYVFGAS